MKDEDLLTLLSGGGGGKSSMSMLTALLLLKLFRHQHAEDQLHQRTFLQEERTNVITVSLRRLIQHFSRKKKLSLAFLGQHMWASRSTKDQALVIQCYLIKAADSSVAVLSRSATFCIHIWFWTKANSDKWRVSENKGNTCKAPGERWRRRVFTCARHSHMLMLRVCVRCHSIHSLCYHCNGQIHPAACPRGKQRLWSFAAKAKFMQSRIRFELISLVSNTFRMHYVSRLSKTHFNAPGCEICAAVN